MRTWWSNTRGTLVCATCVAGAALTLAGAPLAGASRAPTVKERQRIVAAIKSSEELGGRGSRFNVRSIRITRVSTPSVRWAAARIEPKPGLRGDGATVIVGRFYHSWEVIDLGTGGAGCWLPKRVVADLKLDGCAP
jgi:hypothetical protein